MKTKTHYLYGFIIVSLVVALVIASVSKPTPKTIEITPPVERTPEMVTLPPSDTDEDTDDNTDESTEKIYDDNYYRAAIYLFYCFWCFSVACLFFALCYEGAQKSEANLAGVGSHQGAHEPQADVADVGNFLKTLFPMVFIIFWLSILSFAFAVVSLSVDTLHRNQKILMILFTLFIPISTIIGGVLFAITPPPSGTTQQL